jgi:dTMP kinase
MFIAIEGLDGAGTTTQLSLLAARLRERGRGVTQTAEPSTNPIGVLIRQALRRRVVTQAGDRVAPDALALLFASDRLDHVVDVVEPALERGDIVLSDRYVHSSLAYQGGECDMDWVVEINRNARTADLVIFVDVPAEDAVKRIGNRGAAVELFEQLETLKGVRARFSDAIDRRPERVLYVDGLGSVDEVAQRLWSALEAHL